MENGRSIPGIVAGFLFWLGIAYYFYQRDFTGALWFVAACGLLYGVWRLFFYLWPRARDPLICRMRTSTRPPIRICPNMISKT